MLINLLSDTVTKPTPAMLAVMFAAEVGDDVFREDPTVNALEEKMAATFGHEAALFCPSGTMNNQIALKVHTRPLDEVICAEICHIYQHEVGGYAFHSGVSLALLPSETGILTAEAVEKAIKPKADWLPRTSLVCIENTCNKGGGAIYPLENVREIRAVCQKNGLKLHLDGARIFNALVESDYSATDIGREVDSISVCLSKGLGCPVGSVLVGGRAFIAEARRVRKVMGGGMRQAGYLAAAGIFALENNVERLRDDHANARTLTACLAEQTWVADIRPVQSNIVVFDLQEGIAPAAFVAYLGENQVKCSAFGGQSIRFVTHLDVSSKEIETVKTLLSNFAH